jgi:uncharacterized membrane protein
MDHGRVPVAFLSVVVAAICIASTSTNPENVQPLLAAIEAAAESERPDPEFLVGRAFKRL